MEWTENDKNNLRESLRGASNKLIKSNPEQENIFELLDHIKAPNVDIIIDALTLFQDIDTYDKLLMKKATIKIGIFIHNITYQYLKEILRRSCKYCDNNGFCLNKRFSTNGKKCIGIDKCKMFCEEIRISYNELREQLFGELK